MPRARLNRAAIVAAALDLVDAGGPAGFGDLTLAAVAGRVGIAVPSLYKHVSSLADLRREIAIVSVNDLTRAISTATTGRAGRDAVRAMADALREFARRHPGRYAATQVAARPDDPLDAGLVAASAETLVVIASVLRGFDLPPEATIDVIRVLRSAVHGFVVLEIGGGFGLPQDLDRSFGLLVDAVTVGIERLSLQDSDRR
ncbi:TetR-like C-terminal domain-containing protein [Lacisediminihabitans profunda]|uniref:TetR-like C-terminal domain-containing protein n=1 Tax=Lacisediminihabitans profunda TaxID=2594790 RepID=UPI001FED16F3|nr:TetR-like C-terminal domain-containing protein [Lacisediminihabitans profunda]